MNIKEIISNNLKLFTQKNDDSHEFKPILAEIESSPMNPMGRAVFYILIAIILFTILWLFFGKMDIVVTARGKVIPDGEIKMVQPLDTGVVSRINCRPGDFVNKGDVIVEIDPSTTEPMVESSQKNLNVRRIEAERIESLLSGKEFVPDAAKYGDELVNVQKDLFTASKTANLKQIEEIKQEYEKTVSRKNSLIAEEEKTVSLLAITRQHVRDLEKVKDIVASATVEEAEKENLTNEKNLESIKHKLKEIEHEKKRLNQEMSRVREVFRDSLLKELSEKKREIGELEAEITRVNFVNRKKNIIAPVSGHVNELFIATLGGVVTPAQKLLSIVPVETPLIVESIVQNKDIGFIKADMEVKIKIDTFDFQKYGMLKGTVKKISHDSINDEKLGPIYKIYVEPLETSLMVEGRLAPITSGMTVNSEIKVGKRRIIEFFVYPLIKYLHEGMSVR